MCEQTEINYLDGEVVWVKLGSCWWPGEVVGPEKLPPDLLPSFRKPPIAVVKFFQEDTYEYVKNINSIYKYNCSCKNEFIKKGLYLCKTKPGQMNKFPDDVIHAETVIGGDTDILSREEFQETKKESYAGLFGDTAKRTPSSSKKGKNVKGRPSESPEIFKPARKFMKEKADYKVHILVQGSKTPISEPAPSENTNATPQTPSTSIIETEQKEVTEPKKEEEITTVQKSTSTFSTPVASSSGIYSCHACSFSTSRLNVLILHNKTHSVSFIPYTPSPVRKKLSSKISTKSSPNSSKTPKVRRPKKDNTEKVPKKPSVKKRAADEKGVGENNAKKTKTDEEIKSSLLADWDDGDEELLDESSNAAMVGSPEVPVAAGSPAVPTPAELPTQVSLEMSPAPGKKSDSSTCEKPESSSDSKYEFCEDEDWPEETDAGRKIPRVMNPKRKEETKSLSLDEDEVAREVAELLNKTAVPDLPAAPEPLKVEENFPEPSIVKSPDKNDESSSDQRLIEKPTVEVPQTKAIFKTKTFFRSRHSRSQDAIGKYVAEQLNAVERMDISEDINGSEVASSPEPSESSVEHVKVARLAPKIQLKKMKAEAAQLREREKLNEYLDNVHDFGQFGEDSNTPSTNSDNADVERGQENEIEVKEAQVSQDVLYPTQEIKPVNRDDLEPTKLNKANNCEDLNVQGVHAQGDAELMLPIQEDNVLVDNKPADVTSDIIIAEQPDSATGMENIKQADITPDTEPQTEMQPEIQHDISDIINENENATVEYPETNIETTFKPPVEPYMNESTASAVDALLSVSREADRVTRIISNDLPEDLFEDDNKDAIVTAFNGLNEYVQADSGTKEQKPQKMDDKELKLDVDETIDENVRSAEETTCSKMDTEQVVEEVCLPEDSIMPTYEQTEVVSEETNNMGNIPSESDLQIAETLINLPSTAIQNKVGEHNEIVSLSIPLDNEMLSEEAVHTSENMIVDEEISNELNNKTSTKKVEPRGESLLISNNEAISTRFETEQEKSENLNAAQSLVQMSESIDHKIGITESSVGNTKDIPDIPLNAPAFNIKHNNGVESISMLDQNISQLSSDNINEVPNNKIAKFDASTSKLLKILEEPCTPKLISKTTPTKQVIVSGKEKILNFDVAKSAFKGKAQSPKQKIIIRRAGPNKNIVSNISEVSGPADKIILSRTNNPAQDGSAVQTFTIQTSPDTPSDANTIIIQQKIRKITKPPAKLHKLKPQPSLISTTNETKVVNEMPSDEAIYDINSMPIVLSEELLTPESIEKMPIVMTDGNIITQQTNPPKLVKTRQTVVENEKITCASPSKPEVKTLLMNPSGEVSKVTPNILSKSSKLRGAKPMLIIDKTTGKQKIVMTKAEPTVKEPKSVSAPTLIQPVAQNSNKSEKFIILSTPNSPRPARTQKILIDPQTGKAHVLLSKGPEAQNPAENKPVSAKLVPSSSDASAPGNTVMIITNAQGAQSRIVLTPEHEKILFPNKQQSNVSQIKTIAHRLTTNSGVAPKTTIAPMKTQILPSGKTQTIVAAKTQVVASSKTQVVASTKSQMVAAAKTHALGIGKLQTIVSAKQQIGSAKSHSVASIKTPALAPAKTATRIVPKQKSAIITSKGQLIVGGRVATTAQNIAPMPEMRTVPKRIVASEPKKLVQTIQKASSEPLIFLQQKSGAVMQLTAAQFEHLQRTGQIVQKTTAIPENKIAIQKPLTLTPIESPAPLVQKQRVRKTIMESPAPIKKMKQEIAIAPAPVPISPVPTLSPLSNTGQTSLVPAVSNTVSITTTTNFPDLENFEELLPSTAIVRQPEPVIIQPEPVAPPPPAPLSDGQLLAVPGEHFGGPPGSFYLCFEDNGTLTPIDNGPLVLENNQLVPMTVDPLPVLAAQPERRDILEAALANSDVFQADTPRDEAPDFRDLNANVSVHCRVSETSSILNQPIMTPVEVPSKADSEPAVPAGLDAGLAVIGLTPHTVPTSLELPITVTDPRIAPKTTDPLSNNNYGTRLLPSPNTDMSFVTEEMHVPMGGPISMPILTDDESVGKSMPILTDELGERTVSSVESTLGSPSSLEVREEEGGWSRRLLTPVSDTSDASAEIPLQPSLQLSLSHHHS